MPRGGLIGLVVTVALAGVIIRQTQALDRRIRRSTMRQRMMRRRFR